MFPSALPNSVLSTESTTQPS